MSRYEIQDLRPSDREWVTIETFRFSEFNRALEEWKRVQREWESPEGLRLVRVDYVVTRRGRKRPKARKADRS
jgi:hypothetical protein